MSNTKPTQPVDQLAIIRELLEREAAKSDERDKRTGAIESKLDTHMTAAADRHERVTQDMSTLQYAVEDHGLRITSLERDRARRISINAASTRQKSDASFDQEATLGAALAHIERASEACREKSEDIEQLKNDVADLKKKTNEGADDTKATLVETKAQTGELTAQTSMLDEIQKSKRIDRILIILAAAGTIITYLLTGHH